MSVWEQTVYSAWFELGRDFNGHPLFSEKRAWLDEAEVFEPTLRQEYRDLWRELEQEDNALREEFREKTKAQQPRRPTRSRSVN